MPRRLFAALAAILLVASQAGSALAVAWTANGGGGPAASAPIEKGLTEALDAGTTDKFVVEFASKADLRAANKVVGHAQRGKFVLDTLTANASKSQAAAVALAKKSGVQANSYWLYNEMIVTGGSKLATEFAKLPGVTVVRAEKVYPLVKPVETKVAILEASGDPEWGVEKVRAPEAWDEGILGQGVVVGSVDTGVDFTHPALVNQYRGNNGNGTFTHDYNWWDPTGTCGDEPCDDVFHGTHTMGTMVGGDGPGPFTPDVGVAPGARWIAAKGCEFFGCTEEALLSSGQFILAPTDLNGDNPDPSLRPDIVNNSWGGGPGDPFYLATVQAWRAAGIIPVFSSGNPGDGCGDGGSPGDFLESFSAGATDIDDNIADFSGRGPSVYGKINPDISAPGVDVISSIPGGGYESFSGTSMAAPHTSGALALILSAEPALIGDPNNFVTATDAVKSTAVDRLDDSCGGDADGDPNNVYGDGRIDAKAAVDLVATGGTLAGTVTDDDTGDPIPGAKVTAHGGFRDFTVTTDSDGDYSMFLAAGSYEVSAQAFGYATGMASGVEVVTDETTDQDFALVALPRFNVTGRVRTAEDGAGINRARVTAVGTPVPAAVTNGTGNYTLNLPIGTYTLSASAGGCTETSTIEGVELIDQNITVNFALGRKLDDFGHGCRTIPFAWTDATTQTALYGDEFAGRLHLPFSFSFYGTAYDQIFISDNGYLNFLEPEQFNSFPQALPSEDPPNAAIYPLWRDLYLGSDSMIEYRTLGAAGTRTFVLEFTDMGVQGSSETLDFEVKLYEAGERIDILYGNNAANPGDGRGATIGIENETGTDALAFSFSESVVGPNTAFRYEPMPSGIVHGVVRDQNDGLPIAGATVRAHPGLGETKTADDGSYSLRLYPGVYTLIYSSSNYTSASRTATVTDGASLLRNVRLIAPVPTVDPTSVEVSLDFGADPTTATLDLGNDGTSLLTWEAKERSRGSTPPVIGGEVEGTGAFLQDVKPAIRLPVNGGGTAIAHPKVYQWTAANPSADMSVLVYADDPIHPAPETYVDQALQRLGLSYTAHYDADFDGFVSDLESQEWDLVLFADDNWIQDFTVYDSLNTYVENGGRLVLHTWVVEFEPSHPLWANMGFQFSESVFDEPAPVYYWQPGHPAFTFPEEAPELTELESIGFGIYGQRGDAAEGSEAIAGYTTPGPDDGQAGLIIGNDEKTAFRGFLDGQNSADLDGDDVPDGVELWENLAFGIGSGFFTDVPWLSEDPATGSIPAGGSQEVTLTIGDPNLAPGEYRGSVVFQTNAPKPRSVTVDVTLTVSLPDSWGGLSGTVTDAHTGEPVGGATVVLHSEWDGDPLDVTATTGGDGTYALIGPGGTWPLEFSMADYVTVTRDEAVTAGTTRTDVNAELHRNVPHGAADGGPFTFVLMEGETGTGTITLTNPGGHADLTFEVGERPIATATNAGKTSALNPDVDSHHKPAAHTAIKATRSITAQPTLVLMDTLPWDSDALQQVLDANGIGYDLAGSSDMDTVNLDSYHVVFVANDQPQSFYDAYLDNFDRFEGYVQGGGILWFEAAAFGFQDGNLDGVQIPGGLTIHGPQYEDVNDVADPTHPLMAGVPNPFTGTSASHTVFSDVPVGGTVIATAASNGEPTLVEYDHGAGHVIALAQTLEFAWEADQDGKFILENGVPYAYAFQTLSDVPWLSVSPETGSVAPDDSQELTISVDSTGLEPGVYRAMAVVRTNDPQLGSVPVPVTLLVPAYRQGINAGGGAYTDPGTGIVYAEDRGFSTGGFGFFGGGTTRSTTHAIDGTDRDPLYKDLRIDMAGYRFAVPDGTYRVDLSWAEFSAQEAGLRVFSGALEGVPAFANLDVYDAAPGRWVALDRSYFVEVTDGILDLTFTVRSGHHAIINGILVTEIPTGSP